MCKRHRFGYWSLCKCLPNFVNVAALQRTKQLIKIQNEFTGMFTGQPTKIAKTNLIRQNVRIVVSYKRKYLHKVLVYCLFKLVQEKSVVR